jgi:hypothetical protein
MDATSLALSILHAGNLPIPGEVAAELLSMVQTDKVPNSLLNFGEFSGEAAVAVAKSSPQKAKLVAGNTTDVQVQRALFETPHIQDEALTAMLHNKKVSDEALLIDIHTLVWEERISVHRYAEVRTNVAAAAPIRFALEFLADKPGLRGYPMFAIGNRVGALLARGEFWPVEFIGKIAEAQSSSKDPKEFEQFLSQIGRTLATNATPDQVLVALNYVESNLKPVLTDAIAMASLVAAPVVDAHMLEFYLKYLPDAELFREFQYKQMSSHYSGPPSVAPRELLRRQSPYTIEAIRLLAQVHPGALLEVVSELHVDSEHRSEIVDLVLGTNLCILAHALLGKQSTMGGRSNATTLTPEQLHKAVEVYENGLFIERASRPRPEIPAFAAARAIPQGAAIEDVVRLLHLCTSVSEAFYHFYDMGPSWNAISYQPTVDDVRTLLAASDEATKLALMHTALRLWKDHIHPASTRKRPDGFESVVSTIVDSVPASTLAADPSGPSFIAHVFTERFGKNAEYWHHGLGLVPTSSVPLSKVVSAARRMNR